MANYRNSMMMMMMMVMMMMMMMMMMMLMMMMMVVVVVVMIMMMMMMMIIIMKTLMQTNLKTKQVQLPGDQGQQDVASEDKNCASYKWSIRNNEEGIRSEPAVAPSAIELQKITLMSTTHIILKVLG